MRRLIFLSLVLALAGMSRAQPGPATVVLRGGILVDVVSAKEIPASVIVIQGERIEQVGAEGSLAIPAGAQVVDVRSKWIIPGLIDSHAHAQSPEETPSPCTWRTALLRFAIPGETSPCCG